LHMGRRPNLEQMSALMDLLETMLSYAADDQTLFQRLKYDLKQDSTDDTESEDNESEDQDDSGLTFSDSEVEDTPDEDDDSDDKVDVRDLKV